MGEGWRVELETRKKEPRGGLCKLQLTGGTGAGAVQHPRPAPAASISRPVPTAGATSPSALATCHSRGRDSELPPLSPSPIPLR